jgi:hypothetical protein
MEILCIVPCGKKKIWDEIPNAGPTKAKNVYIGPFAKKCREYAENFYPNNWIIISAKYGLLKPDDIVPGQYDVSFNNKKSITISIEELKNQANEKNLVKYDKIIVLGGKNYIDVINKIFSQNTIYNPLSGCKGIGYMMGKLKNSINNDKVL